MAEDRSKNNATWRASKARQESTCYLCPLPQLTAYWTNPPTCPRRICCESKSACCSSGCFRDGKTVTIAVGVVFAVYFIVMDMILYVCFQRADLVHDSKGGDADAVYTPFTHLSIKAILNDQPSQYLIAPSTEWLEYYTDFAKTFYFITPNIVSFTHLIVGFISGKFIASDNLYDRRMGVVLFEIRTWLDAFDGTIFRAQQGNHLKYASVHNSVGFYVDSVFDTLGGCFLCFGIYFYLLKRFGPPRLQCVLPFWSSPGSDATNKVPLVNESVKETAHSVGHLFWKALSFGLVLLVSGGAWDNVVVQFSDVFQTELKDPNLAAVQLELCHSSTTVFIFQLWRLLGSQCILNYILLIIFFDKIWEFLKGTQYILLVMIVSLYAMSCFYVNQIRQQLHL